MPSVWSFYSELYLVQISGLWVHLITIKHNMFLPATSTLAALVTLLLNSLQQRSKWRSQQPDLQPGMLVLLRENNLRPLSWRLAIISDIFPGSDGHVRVVTVKTSSGQFKRPIHKLVALPVK